MAEFPEFLVERDEAEVRYVDSVAEGLEPEAGPGSSERSDCLLPLSGVVCPCVSSLASVSQLARLARISSRRGFWSGSTLRRGHLTQASCAHGVP